MSEIELRARNFLSVLRHCQHLQMTVERADEDGLVLRLPYSDQIVGNPVTGVIHGGAITTLMDTCCGISTVCYLPEFEICPTLDLRIDYMHPAEPGKIDFAKASDQAPPCRRLCAEPPIQPEFYTEHTPPQFR